MRQSLKVWQRLRDLKFQTHSPHKGHFSRRPESPNHTKPKRPRASATRRRRDRICGETRYYAMAFVPLFNNTDIRFIAEHNHEKIEKIIKKVGF
ncbi:hypothetical protein GYH30_049463 [Glycine max]|nr:hypothetical protein GYH30_049463 [Glycine max]